MKINFAMWRKALWTLVKIDSKAEWDELDVISKWLIATIRCYNSNNLLLHHFWFTSLALFFSEQLALSMVSLVNRHVGSVHCTWHQ